MSFALMIGASVIAYGQEDAAEALYCTALEVTQGTWSICASTHPELAARTSAALLRWISRNQERAYQWRRSCDDAADGQISPDDSDSAARDQARGAFVIATLTAIAKRLAEGGTDFCPRFMLLLERDGSDLPLPIDDGRFDPVADR